MPIYEYECSNCKFYVEALQKISEAPLRQCPSCKKQTLKRLVSAPVFRLKGGGWYETDFKSDQEGKRNLAQGEEPEVSPTEKAGAADKSADDKAKPADAAKEADKKPAAAERKKSAAHKPRRPVAKSKSKPKPKPKSKAAKRRR